jgi:hypothetical protein
MSSVAGNFVDGVTFPQKGPPTARTASQYGGALSIEFASQLLLRNTIIAASVSPLGDDNCYLGQGQTINDGGHNLEDGYSCGFNSSTSMTMTNPRLGPLQLNPPGYAIPTLALLPGSPAINAGDNTPGACPPTDERGISRLQAGFCDIGAYEALAYSRFMPFSVR